jgi:hypothetical protein
MTDSTDSNSARSHQRWWLWLPLLGLGSWLALFGDKSPASSDAALSLPTRPPVQKVGSTTARGAQSKASAAAVEALMPLIPRDQLIARAKNPEGDKEERTRDLFSVRSWNPPVAPAPVAAPAAPPLPFSFLGKMLESDEWEVYLARGDQTHIVRVGQVLDGIYRVDKIEPPSLALTYLPLNQAQTLSIGDSQ